MGERPSLEPSAAASSRRYVVLEEVGRGAMGRVLRAYDPKLQREVALKEVRGAALEEEDARRLVAEARAMAKLSHPNVVAIYDVEELDRGRVVLVMEYVPGQTLRSWLRSSQRSHQEILPRFVAAGRGLAAAHVAGLLHRDFKPANVLIGPSDIVKVTDFGIAKVTGTSTSSGDDSVEGDANAESLTQTGVVLGTPRYMAPEQHRSGRSRETTDGSLTQSADQYAFCVALWEALTGAPPFSGVDMRERKVAGPRAWPDTARVPRRIASAVIRGLAPEPPDRWPNMDALLDALAGDPDRRRTKWLLATGGVVAVGLAVAGWQSLATAQAQRCTGAQAQLESIWGSARRAEVERSIVAVGVPYASRVWDRVASDLDAYTAQWVGMHTQACEATTVLGEQSSEIMDLRMACLRNAKADLQAAISVLADADQEVIEKADRLTRLPPLSRCADVVALQADVEPPAPEEAETVDALRLLLAEANAERVAGRYTGAQEKVDRAKGLVADLAYEPVRTQVALMDSRVLDAIGEYEAAEAALRRALRLAGAHRQWDEIGLAASYLMYTVGIRQQRMDEALAYRELALGLSDGAPQREAEARNSIAGVLYVQGKYAEAEAEQRRALELVKIVVGPDHPDVAKSRSNLASTLHAQGKYAEAEIEHRRVLELRLAELGAEHPAVATARNNLGMALYSQGKHAEAEAEHRRALKVRIAAVGPDHPEVAISHNNLAVSLIGQKKFEEAEVEYRRALEVFENKLGSEHPSVAAAYNNIGILFQDLEKFEEAEVEHRRALELRVAALGPDHPDVMVSRGNLATTLARLGKHEEAEAELRRALAGQTKLQGSDHPVVASWEHNLGMFLLARGRAGEALESARRAWARRQREDIPPSDQAEAAFLLARALWETSTDGSQHPEALALARQARDAYVRAGDTYGEELESVETWLRPRKPRRSQ